MKVSSFNAILSIYNVPAIRDSPQGKNDCERLSFDGYLTWKCQRMTSFKRLSSISCKRLKFDCYLKVVACVASLLPHFFSKTNQSYGIDGKWMKNDGQLKEDLVEIHHSIISQVSLTGNDMCLIVQWGLSIELLSAFEKTLILCNSQDSCPNFMKP